MEEYGAKLKGYQDQLASTDQRLTDSNLNFQLIKGLPMHYDEHRTMLFGVAIAVPREDKKSAKNKEQDCSQTAHNSTMPGHCASSSLSGNHTSCLTIVFSAVMSRMPCSGKLQSCLICLDLPSCLVFDYRV